MSWYGFATLVEVKQAHEDWKAERHQGNQQRSSASRAMPILAFLRVEQKQLDQRGHKHEQASTYERQEKEARTAVAKNRKSDYGDCEKRPRKPVETASNFSFHPFLILNLDSRRLPWCSRRPPPMRS